MDKNLVESKAGLLLLGDEELDVVRVLWILELVDGQKALTQVLMLTVLLRFEKFYLNIFVQVTTTHILHQKGELIEFENRLSLSAGLALDFRLVEWSPNMVPSSWGALS